MAKQIGELRGAWRRRVRDGLTHGANAGVRPPLGARGQTAVGHDGLNPKPCSSDSVEPQRLTARFGVDGSPNPLVISANLLNES